jgi:hypothetical protein
LAKKFLIVFKNIRLNYFVDFMKKYADLEKKSLQILHVDFTGNQADDDNFPFYLDEVKKVYEEKQRIAIIFNAEKTVMPAVKFQKMQADWLKVNKKLMTDYCCGTAYIIPSIVIRNVLKAIFTFQKQPVPYLVCKTIYEAEAWTTNQLNNNQNN